jgi:hypothetical protein
VVPHSENSRQALTLCQFCQTTGGSTQLGRFERDVGLPSCSARVPDSLNPRN